MICAPLDASERVFSETQCFLFYAARGLSKRCCCAWSKDPCTRSPAKKLPARRHEIIRSAKCIPLDDPDEIDLQPPTDLQVLIGL